MADHSPASYIHLVHHLIEKCLFFHMSRDECMEALSEHGNINPVITQTVWKELEKENKDFFEAYYKKEVKNTDAESFSTTTSYSDDHSGA